MTDLMKLATDYAQACYNLANPDSYDAERAEEARAALQSAIEALQAENAGLRSECADLTQRWAEWKDSLDSVMKQRNALQSKLDTATQSSAHWQHQCTELQAENEQFRLLAKANSEALGAALAERDALKSKVDAMGKGEPVAIVAEVHMSRYTLEWLNGPVPMGSLLYAAPKQAEPAHYGPLFDADAHFGKSLSVYDDAPKQSEPVQPSSKKTLALAQEGIDLHDHNAPEYIICAELVRLNKALSGAPTPPEAA